MHTCCPNCSSSSAIGNQAASACAECLSVSVAGASLPIGLVVTVALAAGVLVFVYKATRHRNVALISRSLFVLRV